MPLQKSNAIKSVICVRNDNEALRPLYRHLASLQSKTGKRYRARTISTLLELGSCLLFAPNEPISSEFLRAAQSITPDASESVRGLKSEVCNRPVAAARPRESPMAGVRVEQSFGDLREWQKLGQNGHWAWLAATTAPLLAAVARSVSFLRLRTGAPDPLRTSYSAFRTPQTGRSGS